MDFFEAFPSLANIKHEALFERNLRLISISGFVYDKQAIYFEISPEKYWGHLPQGTAAIGIGLPKVNPDGRPSPYRTLIEYLRTVWHCDTNLYTPGYALMIDENSHVSLLPEVDAPFMFHMTRPRLGGANIPDALVQASFLMPVNTFLWHESHPRIDLLKISTEHLDTFLAQDLWSLSALTAQSWCDIKVNKPLPQDAMTRSVLTLRSLRELLRADNIRMDFLNTQAAN